MTTSPLQRCHTSTLPSLYEGHTWLGPGLASYLIASRTVRGFRIPGSGVWEECRHGNQRSMIIDGKGDLMGHGQFGGCLLWGSMGFTVFSTSH